MQLRWRGNHPTRAWDSAEVQAGQQRIEDGRRNRDFDSRHEDRESNVDRSRTRLPASDGFAATTVADDGFAGSLSDACRVTQSVRLVANLGQGFRAPKANSSAITRGIATRSRAC